MPQLFQRGRNAVKTILDRRYALVDDSRRTQEDLSAVTERLAKLESRVTAQGEAIEIDADQLMNNQYKDIMADVNLLRDSITTVQRAVDELEAAARSAVDFVDQEPPHELRKRLFEAHRLAREGSLAIELLLQQELLTKRDINIALQNPAEPTDA